MKFKSTISLLCVTGLMAMALAGCGSSSASTSSSSGSASNSAGASVSSTSESSEVVGQVQSISDKTVTLLLGDLTDAGQNQGGAPSQPAGSGSSGAALSSSSDSSQAPSNGQPGEQPSGQPSGSQQPSQPNGKQPDAGQPGGAKMFTAGTETKAITLTDATVIKVESTDGETDGTIADIQEGAVLDVTLGDDGTAATVTVKNVMSANMTAPDAANAGASAAGSSSAQSSNS